MRPKLNVICFILGWIVSTTLVPAVGRCADVILTDTQLSGPIAMRLVFAYHNVTVETNDIIREFDFTTDRMPVDQLIQCARKRGFETQLNRFSDPDILLQLPEGLPVIIRIWGNDFAVIWREGDHLMLGHYPNPPKIIPAGAFPGLWDQTVLLITPKKMWDPYKIKRNAALRLAAWVSGFGLAAFGAFRLRRRKLLPTKLS